MTITAGIVSDTHRTDADPEFFRLVEHCFRGCQVIIHAGDLTDTSVLEAFGDRTIYAVHGNMCSGSTCARLPDRLSFRLGSHRIGLVHGAGLGPDIESALWTVFPEADCMIYGHTHQPVCHRYGHVLVINPGSFRRTGRYGAPGTYAILKVGETLNASIHEVPDLP